MVLICGDPNESAWFTWGSQSRIHFTHSSNNSLWACLCSDFNLQALRSCWRTLMFCLNESTVLLDTALQSTDSPPPILSPVINTTSAQKYQNLDHMLRKATFSSPPSSFVNNWGEKKYDCCFPLRSIWCVWLHLSRQHQAGFCYLTALQHSVSKPLCRMAPQGMVFVRARAKATTSDPPLPTFYHTGTLSYKESEPDSSTCTWVHWLDPNKSQGLFRSTCVQQGMWTCDNEPTLREPYSVTDANLNMHKGMKSKKIYNSSLNGKRQN